MSEPRLGGRYVVRITPADVGSRVSVRSRVTPSPAETADDGPGPTHTDTVGVLEAWADGVLTIRRRSGAVVHLTEDTMVAGRILPPPPRPRPPLR